jgi:hypothetical protein
VRIRRLCLGARTDYLDALSTDWIGWLDILAQERLLEIADLISPVLVDIGGGLGRDDVFSFAEKLSFPEGRFFVQHLSEVIDDLSAKLSSDSKITFCGSWKMSKA